MIKKELEEGNYPVYENEIAMDRYTLRIAGAKDTVGGRIIIEGKKYILSGKHYIPFAFLRLKYEKYYK